MQIITNYEKQISLLESIRKEWWGGGDQWNARIASPNSILEGVRIWNGFRKKIQKTKTKVRFLRKQTVTGADKWDRQTKKNTRQNRSEGGERQRQNRLNGCTYSGDKAEPGDEFESRRSPLSAMPAVHGHAGAELPVGRGWATALPNPSTDSLHYFS